MRLNWKLLRLAVFPALIGLMTGCGGFSASKSISPASFFLPGLLKADPPAASPERQLPDTGPDTLVARS